MRKQLCGVIAALLTTLVPAAGPAQTKSPALWVIKDADTTIYLFGVAHALTPEMKWFQGPVKSSFEASQELVLEVLQPEPTQMAQILQGAATKDPRPLIERLSPDVQPAYAQRLALYSVPPNAFDRFDPWFAQVNLGALALRQAGYDSSLSGESVLTADARSQGKVLTGLETPEQQFGYLKSSSVNDQLASLERSLRETDRTSAVVSSIAQHWLSGDADAVAADMNAEFRSPAFRKIMITDRNIRWAQWIEHRLEKPGIVFVAVGAGHMGGPDSIRAMLAKDGIQVERVP